MTRTETLRCWLYGLLAVIGLVGTQWNLGAFIGTDGNGGVSGFLDDIVDGPAATFTTIDLLVVAAVVTVFMVVEGRRLRLPWGWVYVVLVFAAAEVPVQS